MKFPGKVQALGSRSRSIVIVDKHGAPPPPAVASPSGSCVPRSGASAIARPFAVRSVDSSTVRSAASPAGGPPSGSVDPPSLEFSLVPQAAMHTKLANTAWPLQCLNIPAGGREVRIVSAVAARPRFRHVSGVASTDSLTGSRPCRHCAVDAQRTRLRPLLAAAATLALIACGSSACGSNYSSGDDGGAGPGFSSSSGSGGASGSSSGAAIDGSSGGNGTSDASADASADAQVADVTTPQDGGAVSQSRDRCLVPKLTESA